LATPAAAATSATLVEARPWVSRTCSVPGGRLLVAERVQLPGEGRVHHAVSPEWAEDLADRAASPGFADGRVAVHGAGRHRRIVVGARRDP
jgi:hypothetical protein